jgi:hypothetical protein
MKNEIINKVAKSGLVNIDLSDYTPKEEIVELDIKRFLFEEVLLKEKVFRKTLSEFDFTKYQNKITGVYCSEEVIIPMWAYMLVSAHLTPYCAKIFFGNKDKALQQAILERLNKIDVKGFKDKKVIVKGCSNIPLSEGLYIAISQKLQDNVQSLMFGEACSAVPIYKKRSLESKQ